MINTLRSALDLPLRIRYDQVTKPYVDKFFPKLNVPDNFYYVVFSTGVMFVPGPNYGTKWLIPFSQNSFQKRMEKNVK